MKSSSQNFQDKARTLLVYAIVCCFFLVTNVVGWNKILYSYFDTVFNPFLVGSHQIAINLGHTIHEIFNKSDVLDENFNLKKKILEYDQIEVRNKDLEERIRRLEEQTKISGVGNRELKMVNVVGAQNIFSSNPQLIIRAGSNQNIKNKSLVYYESNTLFGIVVNAEEDISKVIPFYSPENEIKVPVENLRKPEQKGFIVPISSGVIKITNIPLNAEIFEGDIWITSNASTDIIPNLIVGKTKKITKNTDIGFTEVELEVPFDFNKTNYVFVEE